MEVSDGPDKAGRECFQEKTNAVPATARDGRGCARSGVGTDGQRPSRPARGTRFGFVMRGNERDCRESQAVSRLSVPVSKPLASRRLVLTRPGCVSRAIPAAPDGGWPIRPVGAKPKGALRKAHDFDNRGSQHSFRADRPVWRRSARRNYRRESAANRVRPPDSAANPVADGIEAPGPGPGPARNRCAPSWSRRRSGRGHYAAHRVPDASGPWQTSGDRKTRKGSPRHGGLLQDSR
jgi:hypothetical protein